MNYVEKEWTHADEAIDWIHSLLTLGIKPGLKRMEWMLEKLGNPERRLQSIHIGGTNGKGSTLAMMAKVLQEAGFEVGTFTSPYIDRFQNRIQVNGEDIPDADLLALTKQIKPLADELATTELGAPTEFEVLTMIAILYFAKVAYPDYVLWEVGLGGRYDSTNIIVPMLSIITNIGYDHQHILGEKLEEIAYQKAGIIKAGVRLVCGVQQPEALAVIEEEAQQKKADIYISNQQFRLQEGNRDDQVQQFSFQSMFATYQDLEIQLKGKHQLENASLAIMGLELLKRYYAIIWDEEHLRQGLKKTEWIGRLEIVADEPLTMIDGAHNMEGMQALKEYIQEQRGKKQKVYLFFATMKDKPILPMLEVLNQTVDQLIVTQFDFPRVAKAAEIENLLSQSQQQWRMDVQVAEDWYQAFQEVKQQATAEDLILFSGSLYFIAEVRKRLLA